MVIRPAGTPEAPVPRLLRALAARGHRVAARGDSGDGDDVVWVVGPGDGEATAGMARASGSGSALLVLGFVGTHPDARARPLRALWDLEEACRATGLPTLALRLGPLVGPESPLWLKLRARPPLPRGGRALLQPVVEDDVIETLVRALDRRAGWSGWYELVGTDVLSLAELADLAAECGPPPAGARGCWEPALEVLEAEPLAECAPWSEAFAIVPRGVTRAAAEWAA